jgi:hypothetical protein
MATMENTPAKLAPLLPLAAMFALRASVLVGAIGLTWRTLLDTFESETDFYGWLFFDLGYPEAFVQSLENGLFWGLLTAAGIVGLLLPLFSLLLKGSLFRPLGYEFDWCVLPLLYVSGWLLTLSVLHMVRGGSYAELALGEHAVRFIAPFSLLLLLPVKGVTNQWRIELAAVLLTVAAAATFGVHGWKAFEHYGPFQDLLIGSALNLFNMTAADDHFADLISWVKPLLTTIGIVDLVVAGVVLLAVPLTFLARRNRSSNTLLAWLSPAAFYMAVWGAITAVSRITEMGLTAGWSHAALRAANSTAPLAMGLLWLYLVTKNRDRLSEGETANS